jgi:CheY-like chemotaxis protein
MRLIDHGCGMDPQAIGRLFLPFFTTKPQGRGSGLGLAAIRAALRQAGGGIEVTSAVDAGTTVTVYFPQLRHSEVIEVPKVRQLPPALPNDSTQTILLVEDEPALRSLGQKILARLGYRVLAAANGCEAMEVAANYPFHIDLLFTDVIMPGMNGRELSERLSLERPDMKVLFTSGYTERVFACASVGEQNDASLAGRHLDCLSKPYKPEVLAARIQRILEASQPADPAITTPK